MRLLGKGCSYGDASLSCYTLPMTHEDAIAHWKKGAKDALEAAEILTREGKYSLALFHCHLTVEKALKATFIKEKDVNPPPTHDLLQIALQLRRSWSEKEKEFLGLLTEYAVSARYDDPLWAEQEATKQHCDNWIQRIKEFLTTLL